MLRYGLALTAIIGLSACAEERKDYDASARCQALGHSPGTAAYTDCVTAETTAKLMEQQRREYERTKQEQQDWRLRRY